MNGSVAAELAHSDCISDGHSGPFLLVKVCLIDLNHSAPTLS